MKLSGIHFERKKDRGRNVATFDSNDVLKIGDKLYYVLGNKFELPTYSYKLPFAGAQRLMHL